MSGLHKQTNDLWRVAMSEEKKQDQKEEHTEKEPDTEIGKDATNERVAEEEKSGGALPQNHSDSS